MSDVLNDLVGDRNEFADKTWNRRPLIRRGVAPSVWETLISVTELDRLLASRRSDVHLLKDGTWVDRSSYMSGAPPGPMLLRTEVVDSRNLYREFSEGATIVLLGAHEWWPPLDHLCADLGRSLTMAVQANVYVAPPGLTGHRHHDLHHIFALQLHGTKRWVVEGRRDEPDASPDDAIGIDAELHPGDCLYVPRRFAHHVSTSEAYSTHVTFGVMAPTWSDVISKLVRDRLPPDLLEQPLPPGFARVGAGRPVLQREAANALDATRDMIDRWTTDELVAETVERFGVLPDRTWDGHYESLVGSAALEPGTLAAHRPDVPCELATHHGVLQLAVPGRTLEMPGWLRPAVDHALTGRAFRIAELHEFMDHASADVLVRRLVHEGVLQLLGDVHSPPSDGGA